MHASFPYESNRGREYGGVRRPDVLIQSHPGLDSQDPLVLHNALSAVDDGQVSPHCSVLLLETDIKILRLHFAKLLNFRALLTGAN
jgi:hypothetical protein